MAVFSSQEAHITTRVGQELMVLDALQHLAATELIDSSTAPELTEEQKAQEAQLLESVDHINKAIDAVQEFVTKKNMLAALTDDRVVLTSEQLQNYKKNLPDILRNAVKLSESSHRQTELKQQLQQLQDTITKVTPFKEIDLELFGDFQYVRFIPFYVNAQRRDFVVANIEQLFPMLSLESIDKVGEEYVYVAAVLKDQVDEVMNYLTDHTTLITIQTTVSGSFKDVYRESVHTFENISQQIAVIEQEIQEAARQSMDFLVARDILKSDLEKVFSLHAFAASGHQTTVRVLVAPGNIDALVAAMSDISDTSVKIMERYNHDKIIMRNNSLFKPFEVVTRMMGLPKGNSIDPTPFLALFFVLMFGLALSEAGYALVIALLTGVLLLRKDLKVGVRSLMTVIFYCSLSTIIIGSIFGSWFGVTPEDITETTVGLLPHTTFFQEIGLVSFLQTLQIVNPIKQVVSLMVVMAGLGVIHLFFGLMLNFVQHVKRGEAAEGFYASMSWIIFISLIFVTILSGQGMLGEVFEVNSQYILYLLGAYTVAMIFFVGRESASIGGKFAKGLFDLFFGVIGYVSDMLSYTRLVALGLATGIIAAVVNTLAELAGGGLVNAGGWKFIVGYLVMGVIFVGGHIFNIALNVLGSYITVGRLHFVEFFNKFFESGGEELHLFQPVQESTRIVIQ